MCMQDLKRTKWMQPGPGAPIPNFAPVPTARHTIGGNKDTMVVSHHKVAL